MMPELSTFENRIVELEAEIALLRRGVRMKPEGETVTVPKEMKPLFAEAQKTVNTYFQNLELDPSKGTIRINDQRYVLVRASGLSKDFLETIQNLYADRGEAAAMSIGKNFLFDISHVIGLNDAKNFHEKMHLTDPIAKLSAGPVHFAYTGWAYVDISAESNPTPDENFFLLYDHPYSFEADSWVRAGKKSSVPVCIMNAGYSSGWCEQSFGIPLTAVEITCRAKGDDTCRFIMSPPEKIEAHIQRFLSKPHDFSADIKPQVPTFFERKKVEEEMQRSKLLAEESAKLKSDFVANMSHELRTPLGAILGFAELMDKTDLNELQQEYLSAITNSGQTLLSLINDVLDLSRLDAGKFAIESVPFSIPELLHSVEVMFAPKAAAKGLNLICTVDQSAGAYVSGDPMRLTQILINLAGNAIKFTEKGTVSITCSATPLNTESILVKFIVADTGIGIPSRKVDSVFERFSQADTEITRKYGGSGLGLAITKQLVELQNGTLSVTSKEGAGTEFTFVMPYDAIEPPALAERSNSALPALTFRGINKILIAEDNLMNQKLASLILNENGFEVLIANNGLEAIEILKEQSVDLILMDIQMPGRDGCETAKIIRTELRLQVPVIAMTAHVLPGEREKCLGSGMNEYLSKPYTARELLEKISLLSQKHDDVPPEQTALIDLTFLKKQTKNNLPFIKEMIDIFLEQNPQEINKLVEALQSSDLHQVYSTAHSLKTGIAFFGLEKYIGSRLNTLERLAKAGQDEDEITRLTAIVKTVCERACRELENTKVF